ncbi:MAG TPA: PH domain-containing protein [Gaiellaceae bacterium]
MLERPQERVYLDARRHGIVLVRPLLRALVLAGLGCAALVVGWPVSAAGGLLLVVAAILAVAAVWRWDRTHVVITTEKLFVVHGVMHKRAAAVHLARLGAVELEQPLLGRVFDYGTIVAGELEIPCVAEPRQVFGLVERLLVS